MENTPTNILNWKELLSVINYQSYRRSRSQLFYKKVVLKVFTKFTGKQAPVLELVFLWILWNFSERFFEEYICATSTEVKKSMTISNTVWKVSKYEVFSGPYFPVFGLNMEIYCVSLRDQSKYGKIRARKTPYLDPFHTV